MTIIEIALLPNGAHNNQTTSEPVPIPEGWAVVPIEMLPLEHFPFGEVTAEDVDGVPTVTDWTPGPVPEPEPAPEPEPTLEEQNAKLRAQIMMLQEQQTFLENCILEMADEVYA